MYDVTVSEEFARWFSSLAGHEVEEVASSLDVLGALGPGLDPLKASRLLLWFDGCGLDADRALTEGLALELAAVGERLQELMSWQREVMRCLESPEFAARLAALDAAMAASVLQAVERVQAVLRSTRELESLRALTELQRGGPISSATARYLANQARASSVRGEASLRSRELTEALKAAFLEVLSLAGLDAKTIRDPASGLRELTIATVSPRIRILYGIDAARKRVIVLLGEALTRAYYGDSVRLAERRFREFMAGDLSEQGLHE